VRVAEGDLRNQGPRAKAGSKKQEPKNDLAERGGWRSKRENKREKRGKKPSAGRLGKPGRSSNSSQDKEGTATGAPRGFGGPGD